MRRILGTARGQVTTGVHATPTRDDLQPSPSPDERVDDSAAQRGFAVMDRQSGDARVMYSGGATIPPVERTGSPEPAVDTARSECDVPAMALVVDHRVAGTDSFFLRAVQDKRVRNDSVGVECVVLCERCLFCATLFERRRLR
jgi:hypothetical protein